MVTLYEYNTGTACWLEYVPTGPLTLARVAVYATRAALEAAPPGRVDVTAMSHLEKSLRRLEAHVRANEEDSTRNRQATEHKTRMRLLEGQPPVRQIMP